MSERLFPIQDAEAIPWAMIAPCDRQCQRNHSGQTLEDIAVRGGLGASEACDVLLGLRWSTTRSADAVHLLREIVKDRWYLPEIERLQDIVTKWGAVRIKEMLANNVIVVELRQERDDLLRLSSMLEEHPEGYDGPCLCHSCQVDAQ